MNTSTSLSIVAGTASGAVAGVSAAWLLTRLASSPKDRAPFRNYVADITLFGVTGGMVGLLIGGIVSWTESLLVGLACSFVLPATVVELIRISEKRKLKAGPPAGEDRSTYGFAFHRNVAANVISYAVGFFLMFLMVCAVAGIMLVRWLYPCFP